MHRKVARELDERPIQTKKQRLCKFVGLHWVRLGCQLPKPTKVSEK